MQVVVQANENEDGVQKKRSAARQINFSVREANRRRGGLCKVQIKGATVHELRGGLASTRATGHEDRGWRSPDEH